MSRKVCDYESAGSFRLILFKSVCLEIFYLYLGSKSCTHEKKKKISAQFYQIMKDGQIDNLENQFVNNKMKYVLNW